MQVNNPFKMNDWEIKKFLRVMLSIQFAMWGVIGVDIIGLQIPIVRQLICFIYLTFVPGILILRILRLHKLGNIETLLYAVGLSIATLMFMGLFMNLVYPFFGISGPISITPLTLTMSMIVLCLCHISYKRDKDFCDPSFIEVKDAVSPLVLSLCLIPFLSVFGVCLVNFHQNNIILMFLIIVLSLICVLITFNKFIPEKLYPLAVFVITISLLYHRSLISMYLWGWDIHSEYYLCNLVKTNAIWDSTIPLTYNAMLSIVILAPIFSNICDMGITWVFKIIYPLIFALVPLGLYRVFQKQTDGKIAFLACFFFVSLFTFYGEMLALARQQIAELFLVLLILLIIDTNMDRMKRTGLFILFAFSLAVSHYGLSYIFMFSLIVVCGMFFLNTWYETQDNVTKIITTPRFVALYITFAIAWYMYVSSSSAFSVIVSIGDHIASSIFTQFLNPEFAQGIDVIMRKTASPLHDILKYLHLISQFFIAVGIFTLLLKRKEMKFEKEYAAFSYVNFMICFAGIAVPFFASSLNTTRLYQITLIFLAPFCVMGGVTFLRMANYIVKKSWVDQVIRNSLKALSVFFAIFLLFNSGWVYEVAKDRPGSISLSQESCGNSKDIKDRADLFDSLNTFEQDVYGAHWLGFNVDQKEGLKVCVGYFCSHPLVSYGGITPEHHRILSNATTKIEPGAFVFLGYSNIIGNVVCERTKEVSVFNTTELSPFLMRINNIYSNGGSEVYYNGD